MGAHVGRIKKRIREHREHLR